MRSNKGLSVVTSAVILLIVVSSVGGAFAYFSYMPKSTESITSETTTLTSSTSSTFRQAAFFTTDISITASKQYCAFSPYSVPPMNVSRINIVPLPNGYDPDAIAYDSLNNKLFVAARSANTSTELFVLNGTTERLENSILIDAKPSIHANNIAMDETDQLLFVSTEQSIVVIDATKNSLLRNYTPGMDAQSLFYSSVTNQLYAAFCPGQCYSGSIISTIAPSSGQIISNVTIGSIGGFDTINEILVVPSTNFVFATIGLSLVEADLANGSILKIFPSENIGPNSLAYDPENQEIYFSSQASNSIEAICPETGAVTSNQIINQSYASALFLTESKAIYFVDAQGILEYNPSTNKVVSTYGSAGTFGASSNGMIFDSKSDFIYAVGYGSYGISTFSVT